MRRTFDPPQSMPCAICRGELLLRCIKAESVDSDADIAVYHCARCGSELSQLLTYSTPHDAWSKLAKENYLATLRYI